MRGFHSVSKATTSGLCSSSSPTDDTHPKMSGFEIAGIILGTIPVAISLAQEYRKAIHSWRKYDREVKSLILRLKTEGNILETHCEKLLNGIVSHAEIQPMIREPFGPLWKETHINDMARQRLWESYDAFEETVSGMQEAAEELTNKLRVNSSSQVCAPVNYGLPVSDRL